MVTQELAERLWSYPSTGFIGDTMSGLAVSADAMAIDTDYEDNPRQRLAACDEVLRFIDQDWQSYRAAVAEMRNELSERLT